MNVIKAEFKKYFEEMKAYYPDHIVSLVVNYIFFMGFFISFSRTSLINDNLHIGFIFWFYTSIIISEGSVSISYEKQTGTFEQLLLKPINILRILTVRTWVWIFITTFKIIILMSLVMISLKTVFHFNIMIIPILFITLWGIYGFGMILSGITLLFNKAASFESIISYSLLFFTGGIIPLEQLPNIIKSISQILPLTLGISLSQKILSGYIITFNDIAKLTFNSFIYFLVGITIFKLAYKYSIENGLSSSY